MKELSVNCVINWREKGFMGNQSEVIIWWSK